MTAKRKMNQAHALAKLFGRNEYDLVRAAKFQTNYDELYADIDAQADLAASFSDFYALTPMHALQQKFRDVFIQAMKHKELAEKLAEFNVFVRTATDESALGEVAASRVESAGDYVPFGQVVAKPLAQALRMAGDKAGEKNVKHREEIKKAATDEVEGSSKPSYEAILRISATALAESCENMLLQLDQPETELKAVMDYLVNERMKHALQKEIWALNTASEQTPILNLARNIFFSVHILEKSGGLYLGTKNLMGARYSGPTVKMGGYDIQVEKYLRRQFVAYDNHLYVPLKKKEAAEKSVDKAEILHSMGPELALVLLAEGGRVIHSKEEKAALDAAFAQTKRGFAPITRDEIRKWLSEQDKFITKLSGKKAATLKPAERLKLIDEKLLTLQMQIQKRRAVAEEKSLHEKLKKHKSKIQNVIVHIERTANKLSAMLKGLKLHDAGEIDEYKINPSEQIDANKLAKLSADALLTTAANLLQHYKQLEFTDESNVVNVKQNLAAIKRALFLKYSITCLLRLQ